MNIYILFLGLILPLTMIAQRPPEIEMVLPISHTARFSGTFGELRSDHFHGGLDFKSSNGRSGDPIYASDQGYISRIHISSSGFGRALYIDHPSGYTTVYAHLQSFEPEVEAFVKDEQYRLRSFAVDVYPHPDSFTVSRGEKIGSMGSTGYSFGPHLHFEVRNTQTETLYNPLLFFTSLTDQTPPSLKQMAVYQLDHNQVKYGQQFVSPESAGDTLTIDAWRIAVGAQTFDPHGRHANGIYQIEVKLDNQPHSQFVLDSITSADRDAFNAHIDYYQEQTHSRSLHLCYFDTLSRLDLHKDSPTSGIIPLYRDKIQKLDIVISDFEGNAIKYHWYLKRAAVVTPAQHPPYQHHIHAGKKYHIGTDYVDISFPDHCLYGDVFCQFSSSGDDRFLTPIYHVHQDVIPLKQPIQLSLRPDIPSNVDSAKALIVSVGSRIRPLSSKWQAHHLLASSMHLGSFAVAIDTIPPTIQVIDIRERDGRVRMQFRVDDNLSSQKGHRLKIKALMNSQWHLYSYDLKTQSVEVEIDKRSWSLGPHHLKLFVEDSVGNIRTYDKRFHFK